MGTPPAGQRATCSRTPSRGQLSREEPEPQVRRTLTPRPAILLPASPTGRRLPVSQPRDSCTAHRGVLCEATGGEPQVFSATSSDPHLRQGWMERVQGPATQRGPRASSIASSGHLLELRLRAAGPHSAPASPTRAHSPLASWGAFRSGGLALSLPAPRKLRGLDPLELPAQSEIEHFFFPGLFQVKLHSLKFHFFKKKSEMKPEQCGVLERPPFSTCAPEAAAGAGPLRGARASSLRHPSAPLAPGHTVLTVDTWWHLKNSCEGHEGGVFGLTWHYILWPSALSLPIYHLSVKHLGLKIAAGARCHCG